MSHRDAPPPAAAGKKWLLVGCSVACALALAEVAVRRTDAAPSVSILARGRYRLAASSRLGFEPVPSRVVEEDSGPMHDFAGASNSLGFRDVEHAVAKPPGTQRILVLGDSVGAGLRVARTGDVFPRVLERLLREHGRNVEVLNFSVHGYNTQQEVELLEERGLAFAPDVVLVAYTLSGRERLDGNIYETLLRQRDGGSAPRDWRTRPWVLHSALLRLLVYRVLPSPAPRRATPAREAEIAAALAAVSGDTVEASFDRLRTLAAAHGFRVLVAVFPYFVRDARAYPYRRQHDFVRALSVREGFHHRDLFEPLRLCAGGATFEAVRADWAHPNARGHACAARALAEAVLRPLDGEPPLRGRRRGGKAGRETRKGADGGAR